MIVKGIAKKYLGAITSEQKAARLYDKYAMIIQGLQVNSFYIKRRNRQKQIFLILRGKYSNSSTRMTRSPLTSQPCKNRWSSSLSMWEPSDPSPVPPSCTLSQWDFRAKTSTSSLRHFWTSVLRPIRSPCRVWRRDRWCRARWWTWWEGVSKIWSVF